MVGFRTIAATTAAVLLAAVPAAAAPTATEFPAGPTTSSPPTQVTAGPAGAVWAIGTANPGRVVSMLPDGALTEFVAGTTPGFSLGNEPTGIAVGPDGNLWVAGHASNGAILRLTPSGTADEFAKGSISTASSITAGPDGRVWFTEHAGSHAIAAISTDGSGLAEYTDGLTPGSTPAAIVAGPDGNLWFTETTAGAIGRITPGGEITEFPIGIGKAPKDIAVGPDGAIWYTQSGTAAGIGRITTDGIARNFSTALIAGEPSDIAAGADGAMWFTFTADPGAVGRIDMDGTITSHTVGLTPGRGPQGITAGPDGAMWIAESVGTGYLARISVPPLAGATSATAGESTATLTASVRPNGTTTTYHFEYGAAGEKAAGTPEFGAGAGTGDVAVSVALSGLRPDTKYTARLVASSDAGTSTGDGATFTTAPTPVVAEPAVPEPAVPAAPDPPVATPLPVLGKSVVVRAARGVVMVKAPGQTKARPLSAFSTLPVGSMIDATNGTVRLESALPNDHEQAGYFRAGAFVVRQTASGLTDLTLAGSNFRSCRRPAKLATASAKRKRVVRSLWGEDSGGKFRTNGRYSVASVRGTRWLTQDRCDGTLTKVTEGAVEVRNRRTGATTVVEAGKSHLVRRVR
jgi:virginiamycin B lyase